MTAMYRFDDGESEAIFLDVFNKTYVPTSLNIAVTTSIWEEDPFAPVLDCAVFIDEAYDEARQWWLVARVVLRNDADELILLTHPRGGPGEEPAKSSIAYLIDLPENDYLTQYRSTSPQPLSLCFYREYQWDGVRKGAAIQEKAGLLEIPKEIYASCMGMLALSDKLTIWDEGSEMYKYSENASNFHLEKFGPTTQQFCTAEFDYDFLDEVKNVSPSPLAHFF